MKLRQVSATAPVPLAVGTVAPKSTITIHFDRLGQAWQKVWVPVNAHQVNELRTQHRAGSIVLEELPMESDFREEEMRWLQGHGADMATRYPGEWLAIQGGVLVAHAGTLVELLDLSSRAGVPHPFVTAMPTEEKPVPFYGCQ